MAITALTPEQITASVKAWKRTHKGKSVGGGKVEIDLYKIETDIKHIQSEIQSATHQVIPSFPEMSKQSKAMTYHIGKATYNEEGDATIVATLEFEDEYTHRDSLYPSEYPNGTDDYGGIVLIFHDGINADGHVRGIWHGRMTTSRAYREANNFLRDAVDGLNHETLTRGMMRDVKLTGKYE